MTEAQAIVEASADELHRAFGYYLCAIVRIRDDGFVDCAAGRGDAFVRLEEQGWSQPRSAGVIGRCLRERRPVIVDDTADSARLRGDRGDRPTSAPSSWSRCGSGTRCGARSTSRRPARTPSTRTTPGWSRRWPTRPARRCARPRSTSGWRPRTWAPRRRSPRRSRRRTPTPPATPAPWWSGRWPWAETLGRTGRGAADPALRRDLPRHRQDRRARGDPQQARAAHGRGAGRDRAPHDRRRADPLVGALPGARAAAGPPRARALGRPWLSRPASRARASRSARGSSSPATPTTR